jgi:hypothetical protein
MLDAPSATSPADERRVGVFFPNPSRRLDVAVEDVARATHVGSRSHRCEAVGPRTSVSALSTTGACRPLTVASDTIRPPLDSGTSWSYDRDPARQRRRRQKREIGQIPFAASAAHNTSGSMTSTNVVFLLTGLSEAPVVVQNRTGGVSVDGVYALSAPNVLP